VSLIEILRVALGSLAFGATHAASAESGATLAAGDVALDETAIRVSKSLTINIFGANI